MCAAALLIIWSSVATVLVGAGVALGSPLPLPVWQEVSGDEAVHRVASGETLGHITARFGTTRGLTVALNALDDPDRLRIGQRLRLSNRHIVPATLRDGVVINVGDLTLYWLRDGALVESFPVGVGRAAWQTPAGHYQIVSRRRDPVWHVPRSIQREMVTKGELAKTKVPPGPDNPLGKYWLQLSVGGYGIHGTNAPRSVGKYTTHGCIRMRPDDIERLYTEVPNGTPVDIVNEPVKLARLPDGRILLEAHGGPQGDTADAARVYLDRLRASEVRDLVDTAAAQRVLGNEWGIAIDVSR